MLKWLFGRREASATTLEQVLVLRAEIERLRDALGTLPDVKQALREAQQSHRDALKLGERVASMERTFGLAVSELATGVARAEAAATAARNSAAGSKPRGVDREALQLGQRVQQAMQSPEGVAHLIAELQAQLGANGVDHGVGVSPV